MEYSNDLGMVLRSLLPHFLSTLVKAWSPEEVMALVENLPKAPISHQEEVWLCRDVLCELLAQPEILLPALEHLTRTRWSQPSSLLHRAFPGEADRVQSCLQPSDLKRLQTLDPRVDQFRRRFLQSLANYWLVNFPARPQPENLLLALLEQDPEALSRCFHEFVSDNGEAVLLTRLARVKAALQCCGEAGALVWIEIEAQIPQTENLAAAEPGWFFAYKTFERFLRFSRRARVNLIGDMSDYASLAGEGLAKEWIDFALKGDPWY